MRPDEHKKKRSAAYKKKHGTEGPEKPKSKGKSHPEPTTVEETESTNSEDEAPGGFRRKPIESNWDRYKPMSDEDEDQGADYNVLLSYAGDASSHMKLKDEQEWDEDHAEHQPDVLSIDHKRLEESLSGIPFVERYNLRELGLDPILIDYIADMDEDELSRDANSGALAPMSGIKATDLGFDFSLSGMLKTKSSDSPEISTVKESTKDDNVVMKPFSGVISKDKDDLKIQAVTTPKKIIKKDIATTKPLDGDIGNEINVSKTDEKAASNNLAESAQIPKSANKVLDEPTVDDDFEVDKLLSSSGTKVANDKGLANNDSLKTKSSEIQSEPAGVSAKEQTEEVEDLEDWLDSIL